jgi:hypothetical protein
VPEIHPLCGLLGLARGGKEGNGPRKSNGPNVSFLFFFLIFYFLSFLLLDSRFEFKLLWRILYSSFECMI